MQLTRAAVLMTGSLTWQEINDLRLDLEVKDLRLDLTWDMTTQVTCLCSFNVFHSLSYFLNGLDKLANNIITRQGQNKWLWTLLRLGVCVSCWAEPNTVSQQRERAVPCRQAAGATPPRTSSEECLINVLNRSDRLTSSQGHGPGQGQEQGQNTDGNRTAVSELLSSVFGQKPSYREWDQSRGVCWQYPGGEHRRVRGAQLLKSFHPARSRSSWGCC